MPAQFDQSTYESSYNSSPRQRLDSNQVLMLPAPLSVGRPGAAAHTPSVSTIALSRESEEGYNSDIGSQQRLVSPQEDEFQPNNFEARVSRTGGVLRQNTNSAQFPGETQNPYTYSPQSAGFADDQTPFSTEPEDMGPPMPNATPRTRGISLSDHGPVPGPGGVRRVSRQQGRRPSSQAPPPQGANRYSRNFSLPPGAAPPQSGYGY